MINTEVTKVLNEQIKKEFYSAYLYLSMSAHFSDIGLLGFANWMRVQAQEEQAHAMLIYDFVINRGAKVLLDKLAAPKTSWASTLDAMEDVLKHECFITESINNVISVAETSKDRATMSYFQWFVDEQVQEEASAIEIIQKLKLIGEDKSALYLLDKDLSARIFTPPAKAGVVA